jgi:hypothetical protein
MKTNVLLAGLVLAALCFLAGVPLLGAGLLVVAVGVFMARNGLAHS